MVVAALFIIAKPGNNQDVLQRWVVSQTMVHSYQGILPSDKNEYT